MKMMDNQAFFALLKPLDESATALDLAVDAHCELQCDTQHSPYPDLKSQVEALCDTYRDIFTRLSTMPPKRDLDFCIDLEDESTQPPAPRRYQLSPVEETEVRK